jgi:hypothetical protein
VVGADGAARCLRQARETSFVALAPDLYRGKTTDSVEEAEALSGALDQKVEQWRGDIVGAMRFLRQNGATIPADGRGVRPSAFARGAYALDMSVTADEVAVVIAPRPGLDYRRAKALLLPLRGA